MSDCDRSIITKIVITCRCGKKLYSLEALREHRRDCRAWHRAEQGKRDALAHELHCAPYQVDMTDELEKLKDWNEGRARRY